MRGKIVLTAMLASVLWPGCKEQQEKTADIRTIDYNGTDSSAQEKQLFSLLDSTQTGISFSNPITETDQVNIITYEYLYNGGGVAAGDINNDGLTDLYFSGNMVPNKLYLNLGNFRFRDITLSSGTDGGMGFKTGVTMADINNDGLLDIHVCKSMMADPQYRKNIVYINNGNLTFTDRAAAYGLDDASYSTQAYFFDMDTDGDADLYLVNHPYNLREGNNIKLSQNSSGKMQVVNTEDPTYVSDKLFENMDGRFVDISLRAGVREEGFGLSAVISDFNNDSRPDIYVCNDYIRPDYLWINNGNNTFTDRFSEYFSHSAFSSMGSDYADINNDARPDLMTLDMLPRERHRQHMLGMLQNYDKFQKMLDYGLQAQYVTNTLQLNNGNGTFSDISFMSNTAYTDWSWSTLLADFDNDGWKDIFVTNGFKRDITNNDYVRYKMDTLQKQLAQKKITLKQWVEAIPGTRVRSYLFRNNRDLSFGDVSESWNVGPNAISNGAAYADLDNDGYLDIIINNIDDPVFILKNEGKNSRGNHFIRFQLAAERPAMLCGARVKIHYGSGLSQVQELNPTRGFLSSVEPVIHFGLGDIDSISSVEILWPDATRQSMERPAINKLHRVVKIQGEKFRAENAGPRFFESLPGKVHNEMSHEENPYIDFKREPLLHHKYSEEGPATAAADVNGDGLDDVYIGGALGFPGKLFIQKKDGSFTKATIPAFDADKDHEDIASAFVDLNGDGPLDLVVISGGNERPENSSAYQDRIYLNDGKGGFSRAHNALPSLGSSGGSLGISDIDKDGDPDLFIGGRISPGRFPLAPASQLLRNDKGKFTDVTAEWSEGLQNVGMITDCRFADLDKDGTDELVLTGEWMPVTIFKKDNGKYRNVSSDQGTAELSGWWYSLEIADVNGDGFPDILAGNLGLNSQLQASAKKPVNLHYKDFDNNGTIDPVLCCYYGDKSYPLHFRDRVLDQMIFLKKKFTRYAGYADATLEQIFTPEQLKDAKLLTANHFSHTLFINEGGKKFRAMPLPRYTQISTVRSIRAMDVNGDQKMDVVLGGNFYATDAQFGRYDASIGAVLLGDGAGNFQVVDPVSSGFSIPGNVRSIVPLKSGKGMNLLVVRNGAKADLFRMKQ